MAAWGLLFAGATIAGAALAAKGKIDEGNAAKQAAEENAAILEQDARYIENVSLPDRIRQIERKAAIVVGQQRAAAGKGGVVALTGSPLDAMRESLQLAEEDVRATEREGQFEAAKLRRTADIQRRTGKQMQINSRWGAASSLLGGAGSIGLAAASGKAGSIFSWT